MKISKNSLVLAAAFTGLLGGTMARVPDLVRFCKKHNLLMVTVDDLARYRLDVAEEGSLEASLMCV